MDEIRFLTRLSGTFSALMLHERPGEVGNVQTIPRRERVRIAGEAGGADERSVAKVLRGEVVRGESGKRIIEVLRARGIHVPAAAPKKAAPTGESCR